MPQLGRVGRLMGVGKPHIVTSYTSGAQALFDAWTGSPNSARRTLINNWFISGAAEGWLAKLDFKHNVVGTEHDTSINFINPATFTLTKNGAPTFLADRYWLGDGTTGVSLSNGFNPTTAPSPKFTQDSHCMILGANFPTGQNSNYDMGITGCAILGRNATDQLTTRSASSTGDNDTQSPVNTAGHVGFNRNNSANYDKWVKAVKLANKTRASSALGNETVLYLGRVTAGAFSIRPQFSWAGGGALTDTEYQNYIAADVALNQGIGAL